MKKYLKTQLKKLNSLLYYYYICYELSPKIWFMNLNNLFTLCIIPTIGYEQ